MRAILGAVAGAVVLFCWGAAFWMGLADSFGGLRMLEPAQERAVIATLTEQVPETGVYYFPGMPTHGKDLPDAEAERLNDEWTARYEAGPLGVVQFTREGKGFMEPVVFVRGFGINLISTVLVAILVVLAGTGGFLQRFAVVAIFGVAATVSVHLIEWNWMYTPTDYMLMAAVDTTVGWVLAGLVMAAIIKTPKGRTASRANNASPAHA